MQYHIAKHSTLINKTYNGVLHAILNRPNKLNAVNIDLCNDIISSVPLWNQAQLLILSGNGKAFSAGGDLRFVMDMASKGQMDPTLGDLAKTAVHAINSVKPLLVTILNGFTMGIACGFGLHAPVRIATENTRFAMPETRFGWVPDGGAGLLFSKVPHNFGLFLALTGEQIDGIQMCHLGLADFLVESSEVGKICHELEESRLLRDADSIRDFLSKRFSKVDKTEPSPLPQLLEEVFASSELIDLVARLERKFPEVATKVTANSRFAQFVAFEQHRRNIERRMSLSEHLVMEQRILERVAVRPDLLEGLKRLFVDKQYIPKWQPADYAAVSLAEVAECFQPLQRAELQLH